MKKILTLFVTCLLAGFMFSSCGANNSAQKNWVPKISKNFGEIPQRINWLTNPDYVSPTDSDKADEHDNPKYVTPPSETTAIVLSEGKGRTIQNNDNVIANYYAIIYGKTAPFDSSFLSASDPLSFKIGSDSIIKGWSKGLEGKKTGSRVLLSVPPVDGYGASGNENAGIGKTDVLEFVIDIIASFPESTSISATDAKLTNLKSQITVKGKLGSEPNINIVNGGRKPNAMVTTVIAKGNGKVVKAGNYVVTQYKTETWSGQVQANTYQVKMLDVKSLKSIKNNKATIFSNLIGMPIGSRVLIQTPGKDNNYPTLITVIDIITQISQDSIIPPKYKAANKKRIRQIERDQEKEQESSQSGNNLVGSQGGSSAVGGDK